MIDESPGGVEQGAQSWPAPACAWCGTVLGDRAERLAGRRRCRACGVATTDPWPSEEELERAYGDRYRPSEGRFVAFGDALLRRTRATAAQVVDRRAPPGPVLDVGAGAGALVDALRARGRVATGLERGPSAHPQIREQDLAELEGEWAAIVFWHSLEHLPDPAGALKRAASLLSSRGLLVVAAPNPASFQAAVFGDRWLALDLPRHLFHIPAPALLARLRQLDLTVERTSYLAGGQSVFGWLHGLVGRLPSHPDLYTAIRRPEARPERMRASGRVVALCAGAALLPVAAICAGVEAALRRGGSVYVEARHG